MGRRTKKSIKKRGGINYGSCIVTGKHYLKSFEYGNADTGEIIDRFWLDGPLDISTLEQVEFLKKVAEEKSDNPIVTIKRAKEATANSIIKIATKTVIRNKLNGLLCAKSPFNIPN